jgi:thymidylate kinase
MKRSILITGVPGSGKSTLNNELVELGFSSKDIEIIPDLYYREDKKTGEIVKIYDSTDIKQLRSINYLCDLDKLQKLINQETESLTFYCGDGRNIEDMMKLFDVTLLLQASDETIIGRLSTRQTGMLGSTAEVREWVLEWKPEFEKTVLIDGAIPINAEKSPEDIAQEIIRTLDI